MIMKYWGYLLLKLVAAAVAMRFVWLGILLAFRKFGPEQTAVAHYPGSADRFATALRSTVTQRPFAHDLGFTTATLLFFLACFGLMYLIIWDQRYRCRTCLRRLRMPVRAGSWPNMFLIGQPRMEYICLYGHGTLKVPEVRITTKSIDWERHGDDIWKELEALEESKR